jgi:hypothetical protein
MKKRPEKTNPSKVDNAGPRGGWAFVYEPDDPSCEPTAKWGVRYRHVELTGQYDIEIRFRTRGRKRDTIIMSARDRSEFEKIRRELCARDARLPDDRKASTDFVEKLLRATPKQAVEVVSKPGFRDSATGFVMPARMYGTAEGRFVWDDNFADPAFGEVKGDLAQYQEGVLRPALASPFLSFASLISLAAPLPSYVEQKDGCGKLVPEGAIFHFAADSSAGKTLSANVTLSVFGSPAVTTDYESTPRGVAEACYGRNDLVMVLDDTESGALDDHEVLKKMTLYGQRLPSGRSKVIAKSAAKSGFPRHDLKQRRTPVMSERALGLRVSRENKSRWYICPDRLDLVGVKDPRVRRLIIEKAKELKLIVASNNASSSVQMRVRTAEGGVRKLRVWRLRRDRTLAWAENRRRVRQR